ncbi:hypothetical protein MMC12_003835 [Toensbergia leucococca]|nr:hypothetical protein [Toensbergia leucococca]
MSLSATTLLNVKRWDACQGAHEILCRFAAAFVASWFSLHLLNTTKRHNAEGKAFSAHQELVSDTNKSDETPAHVDLTSAQRASTTMVGRTMDLTLFALVRALESVVFNIWTRHRTSRIARKRWTIVEVTISRLADAGIFAFSAGVVMWAWFYIPDRLPRAYNRWIRDAAQVDQRLVEALRRARWGDFVYGYDTGQAPLLESMCTEYGWPLIWGNPAKTIPIPCEMVHMGTGPSCHWHAAIRFARTLKFALATNLPLQLLVKGWNPSYKAFRQAVIDALRSSAFLGAFAGAFYYSVCLSRTTVGPRIFSTDRITPLMWDSGLCVGTGCAMCGWSILIESEKRRQEIAFFVAPRALATIFPRRYEKKVGCSYVDPLQG